MPPMDSEPDFGDDAPMGGGPGMDDGPMGGGPGMDDAPMGGGPGMGDEPMGDGPMGDGPDGPMGDGPGMGDDPESQEMMDIFNNLSDEAKDAVKKYAESQQDNDNGGMDSSFPNDGGQPQMESRKSYRTRMVNEIMNSIIGDMNDREGDKGTKRDEKRITNRMISKRNPFVANR